mgnify:CR=1 FL=1
MIANTFRIIGWIFLAGLIYYVGTNAVPIIEDIKSLTSSNDKVNEVVKEFLSKEKDFMDSHASTNYLSKPYVDTAISMIPGVKLLGASPVSWNGVEWEKTGDEAMKYTISYSDPQMVLTMLDKYNFYYEYVDVRKSSDGYISSIVVRLGRVLD